MKEKLKLLGRNKLKIKKIKHVRLTKVIYVEPFVSHTPIAKEIRVFEKEHRGRELEEELEVTLNFLKRTIIFITKPASQVIIISNLEEEVEIRPQIVIKKQLQSIFASKPMEEEEL